MGSKPWVLAVDANHKRRDVLVRGLSREGHQVLTVGSLEELDKVCASPRQIGLVVINVLGFDHQLWWRCDRLRDKRIPFVTFSAHPLAGIPLSDRNRDPGREFEGPKVGAALFAFVRSMLPEAV